MHGYEPHNASNIQNLILCDCPGIEDSRGEVYDLSSRLSLDFTIKNARSIKCIVLTLPYEDFWGSRCRAVLKLFEDLENKLPNIFEIPYIHKSVYLLITKYNKTEPLEKNLEKAAYDALSDEKELLGNLKEEDDFLREIINNRIKIWKFILKLITENRIITINIKNKKKRIEILENFAQSQNIEKTLFSKAMNNSNIERNFSKYISMHLDTCKNRILKVYFKDLVEAIKDLEKSRSEIQLEIQKIEQKNENLQKSININENEKKNIESSKNKLQILLNSKDNNQMEKVISQDDELKQRFQNAKEKRDDKLSLLEIEIDEKKKEIDQITNKIKILEQNIDALHHKIIILKKKNEELSNGSEKEVLHKNKEYSPDDDLSYLEGKIENFEKAFNEISNSIERDKNDKVIIVKAGSFTGTLIHHVFISKEYYIVPKDGSCLDLKKVMYNKDFFQEGKKYKAIIDGHNFNFHFGMKAHPSRKEMVYSLATTWKAGQKIPWFEISHYLPNIDKNEAKIINNEAKIKSLNKKIIDDEQEIEELKKKEKNLQKNIEFINRHLLKIKIVMEEHHYNELKDQIANIINSNDELLENYNNIIKNEHLEIENNEKSMENEIENLTNTNEKIKNAETQKNILLF